MESTLTMISSNLPKQPFLITNSKPKPVCPKTKPSSPPPNPFISHLKTTTTALIFAAAALKLHHHPAIACVLPPPPTLTQQLEAEEENIDGQTCNTPALTKIIQSSNQSFEDSGLTQILELDSEASGSGKEAFEGGQRLENSALTEILDSSSEGSEKFENLDFTQVLESNSEASESRKETPLGQFLESNSEGVEALKGLLQQKLEAGEDEEGMKILENLILAQPENNEWRFLMARLYNEMGKVQEARDVFEAILKRSPFLFEGLFENALLMDRSGEGQGAIRRLEQALRLAEDEGKVKEARDVRLIIAQMQFLQKNVEEALRSYEELLREDPKDFRPYFCKGMIYSLMDRNEEAKEQFAKSRELSPKKYEVEGYLRSPLSRMKLFGTGDDN